MTCEAGRGVWERGQRADTPREPASWGLSLRPKASDPVSCSEPDRGGGRLAGEGRGGLRLAGVLPPRHRRGQQDAAAGGEPHLEERQQVRGLSGPRPAGKSCGCGAGGQVPQKRAGAAAGEATDCPPAREPGVQGQGVWRAGFSRGLSAGRLLPATSLPTPGSFPASRRHRAGWVGRQRGRVAGLHPRARHWVPWESPPPHARGRARTAPDTLLATSQPGLHVPLAQEAEPEPEPRTGVRLLPAELPERVHHLRGQGGRRLPSLPRSPLPRTGTPRAGTCSELHSDSFRLPGDGEAGHLLVQRPRDDERGPEAGAAGRGPDAR